MALRLTITHWVPIITFCPVNKLPDVIYVSVTFTTFEELYAVRKRIRKIAAWRQRFMEDIALDIATEFPEAKEVRVALLFNKHVVTIQKEDL